MATSDIDELLEDLRNWEAECRDDTRLHGGPHSLSKDADRFARQIAAVEKLRDSDAHNASIVACDWPWISCSCGYHDDNPDYMVDE